MMGGRGQDRENANKMCIRGQDLKTANMPGGKNKKVSASRKHTRASIWMILPSHGYGATASTVLS